MTDRLKADLHRHEDEMANAPEMREPERFEIESEIKFLIKTRLTDPADELTINTLIKNEAAWKRLVSLFLGSCCPQESEIAAETNKFFSELFGTFMDEIYEIAEENVRKKIAREEYFHAWQEGVCDE
jgi:hypothetical protein